MVAEASASGQHDGGLGVFFLWKKGYIPYSRPNRSKIDL